MRERTEKAPFLAEDWDKNGAVEPKLAAWNRKGRLQLIMPRKGGSVKLLGDTDAVFRRCVGGIGKDRNRQNA